MQHDDIPAGFAFYGYIPDGSKRQHLGIVLGVKSFILKYCYETSKFKKLFKNTDYVKIPAKKMKKYFNNPEETYIFLSQNHIIDIQLITFNSRLTDSEYERKGQIDNDIFIAIMNKIDNSNNLSERFKHEFFEFIKAEV
jgi:hypothetical protein